MPPTFQVYSSSVEVEVNQSLMLSVTIDYNYPLSGISWIFNGSSLMGQSRVSVTIPPVFEVPAANTSLQINSAIPRDAGVLCCHGNKSCRRYQFLNYCGCNW